MRAIVFLALLVPLSGYGGAQIYEPLADSVRQRLSRMVADRAPASMHFREPTDGQRWLAEMDRRLERRIPDRSSAWSCCAPCSTRRRALRSTPARARHNRGRAPFASTRCRVPARGYMQVMPFWLKLIGRRPQPVPPGDQHRLRLPSCGYLDLENGDYYRALGRYNGSLGRSEYPNLVLAAWRGRWKYEGPTA
jgi:hypothetical protein